MNNLIESINYKLLNPLQVGRIGEYLVKLNLTLYGLDVYTTEVDDKGIDFIIRINDNKYIDVQVKTIRSFSSYVYIDKTSKAWQTPFKSNLFLALVILNKSYPSIYLIPATAWNEPNNMFKSRDYPGSIKSKPDWGLNLSLKNLDILSKYEISKVIPDIIAFG